MYASEEELASYLQVATVDTATATLVLETASAKFSLRAATMWAPTEVTWTAVADGCTKIRLPFRPVISVEEVRVDGEVITDWTLINGVLYRTAGFGTYAFPPQALEVDLIYGHAEATDDVKGAVLETAASAYQSPDAGVQSESIDDYAVRRSTAGLALSPSAAILADLYRGTFAA
jgi:hypothetical protein